MENSRIFIRGLPPNLDNEKGQATLKKHFSAGGREVTDVKVIPHRRIGFVGFKTPEEAQSAVRYFDRSFLKASRLSVSLAKPVDDPSLQKSKKGESQYGGAATQEANLAVGRKSDTQDAAKKRKREEPQEANPKLAEYLRTFQPGKSSANEVAEMLDPAAVAEQEKLLQGAESDDEYESIPARPEKKQMREAPKDQEISAPIGTNVPMVPNAEGAPAAPSDQNGEVQPEDQPPKEAVTDDDWLRSRTNRLLDLLDDDEDIPQRPQPAPPQVSGGPSAGDQQKEGQEISTDDPQTQVAETAAEDDPSPRGQSDEDAAVATIRKTARIFVRNLAFTTGDTLAAQEEDLRSYFGKHGDIEEVGRPVSLYCSTCVSAIA